MLSPVGKYPYGVLLDSSCDALTDYMTTLHAISPYKLEVIFFALVRRWQGGFHLEGFEVNNLIFALYTL